MTSDGNRRPTQAQAILELLRQQGAAGLTPLQALEQAGCFRLAARVYELVHEDGHEIETLSTTLSSGKRVAKYVLHERPAATTGEQQALALRGGGGLRSSWS